MKYAVVILEVSIDKSLTYSIPGHLASKVKRGVRVEVPVRGHMRTGYVIDIRDTCDFPRVFPISKILSEIELLTEDLFELALWMAKYYCAPLRQVFKTMLPSSVRKDIQAKEQLYVMRGKTREELKVLCEKMRGKQHAQTAVLDVMLKVKKGILLTELLELTEGSRSPIDTLAKKGYLILDIVRVDRSPLVNEEYVQTRPKTLNSEQAVALSKISNSLENHLFETHLVYGVTGSGKTEVYLQSIDKTLKMGKGVIMLIPEISLTAQTIERFRCRFEGKIAILHCRLSHGERFDEWNRIYRGEASIVIGARSAIFSPVKNLGLIIVDEEHENSYKQTEETPCYHARDIAVMRGKMGKSTVILGSATPSLESFYNAKKERYVLSTLQERANSATIPTVKIVDMNQEFEKNKGFTNFSETLLNGIKKRQAIGEQSILFLNRRGYHTTLLCQECNEAVKCLRCDVAMTFHLGENCLACHLCSFQYIPPPSQCPKCRSPNPMKYRGVGTEQIQKAIHAIFPDIRTVRIDADTTRHKGSHQKLLREFGSGKADLLIGTQMIAKGLHFPQVTLVGVLNSDSSLNIPDFRASETVFQLITQVSGRAGRGQIPGEVIIQTHLPTHSTIQLAAKQDYDAFYAEEIEVRRLFSYPPFCSMVKIAFSGTHQVRTVETAEALRSTLIQLIPSDYEIHPVIPAGHVKVKDRYRYQFLIRGQKIYTINRVLEEVIQKMNFGSDIRFYIDINPISTFF